MDAGDFVSYLLARHGAERFDEFLSLAPFEATDEEVARAFEDVYGMSLAEAVAERWDSGWRFRGGQLRVPQCAAEPIEWDGSRWRDSLTIHCDINAVGYDTATHEALDRRRSFIQRYQTIDVPTEGLYRIEFRHERGAWLKFGSCSLRDGEEGPVGAFQGGTPFLSQYDTIASLQPGRYFVEARIRNIKGLRRLPQGNIIAGSTNLPPRSCRTFAAEL